MAAQMKGLAGPERLSLFLADAKSVMAARYGPPIGSVVTVPNPPLSVAFNGNVQNLKMVVDGRDVTREAVIGNEGISRVPRSNLNRGQHSVIVTGNALNGQPVNGNWHFFVQY